MGHAEVAKELHVFGQFLSMKGKKVVPHQKLAIMARSNKVQCCVGGHKGVSLRVLDAKDVMVSGSHAREKRREFVPVNVR